MNCFSCSCNDIVGYRFHPTDKELIDHYLWNKALDRDSAVQAIGEVVGDLCDWEPEELSRFFVRRSNDQTWYLFSQRNHSKRVKRKTKLGFWKLTGKNRSINANVGIGTKKTLVFYEGRFPKGKWTPWVIHEYTLPDTIPNLKGIFLCKLKRKDDEKAAFSSGEDAQPSNAGNDKIFYDSLDINIDELLALLGDTNGSNEVEIEVASAQKPQIYGEQVPSCNAASHLYNPGDDFDGVQNQSSTNEQDDELYPVFSMLQSQMDKEHVPSCNDISFFCGSNGNFQENQHQVSTNEQDDGIQHQPSTNEQDEMQHQSSTNEQDEYWNYIFINDYDACPDERSNALFVGSESSNLLVSGNIPIESSRKRPRIDDVGLNDVIESGESQARVMHRITLFVAPMTSFHGINLGLSSPTKGGKTKGRRKAGVLSSLTFSVIFPFPSTKTCVAEYSKYGQARGTSSMFVHSDLNEFVQRSFDEALNLTLFAVDHTLHSSERRLDILNELRKMSASSFDFVADVPFICSPMYSVATRIYSPQNEQKPPNLIVEEPTIKGIPVQRKFFRKMASAEQVRGTEEHVTAMDMPQKGNTIIKSNIDQKMTG